MILLLLLIEFLLIPQIPCPLVQPFPILVPKPTSKPPIEIINKESVISDSISRKNKE